VSCGEISSHDTLLNYRMKTIIFALLCLPFGRVLAQSYGIKSISKGEADTVQFRVNKGLHVGVSLGINHTLSRLYEATISPIDNRLSLSPMQRSALVMSTVVAVPLSKGELGGSYARRLDGQNKPYGPVYYVPYGVYLIAAVNLTTFQDAMKGGVFNQKIDGGLGLGYRLNSDLQIALTFEKISVRQPREFLFDYKDKVITINNQPLTSLDINDNNFFRTDYLSALSVKFVYIISGKKSFSD